MHFFSVFKDLLYKLIPPLLSKEIIVSDVIFDAMIEAIKSDDGAILILKISNKKTSRKFTIV